MVAVIQIMKYSANFQQTLTYSVQIINIMQLDNNKKEKNQGEWSLGKKLSVRTGTRASVNQGKRTWIHRQGFV